MSESVIDGIAHALELDQAERAHLLDLLQTAGAPTRSRRRRARASDRVRPTIQRLVDGMPAIPAVVLNGRLDVLAQSRSSASGRRSRTTPSPCCEPSRPYDNKLTDLVGELCTRREDFRVRWAAHDVRIRSTGVKQLDQDALGLLASWNVSDTGPHRESRPAP